ncbi:MAG: endonuclease [Aeromicrobium sp.]|nr:endonuclease [Aeromicrobium sp.]
MSVFAAADTIEAAAEHLKNETENPGTAGGPAPGEPAKLAGFGSIGPSLLMYFLCISDFTAFLMTQNGGRRQAQILNVGRTYRLATMKQRRGGIARQQGVCAAAGCHHTHLEIHHVIWYSRGGTTDLDLLIGLCRRLGPSQEARSGEGAPSRPQEPAKHHRQRGRRFLRRGYALTAAAPFSPPAPAGPWADDDEPATTRPPDTTTVRRPTGTPTNRRRRKEKWAGHRADPPHVPETVTNTSEARSPRCRGRRPWPSRPCR